MADMGKTEVQATIMERVTSFVQAELKQRALLMPLVQNFDAKSGEDTIKIPRADGFSADDKSENTALTTQAITFVTDDLPLDKHKAVLAKLEDIANIQATPDVVNQILSRMASEIALQIDRDIVNCLKATSAAAPDHRVAYANSGTDNTLGKADILEARKLLHTQNVPFNQCYIGVNPASEVNLLAIDDFVHVNKYGSPEGLVNGELGKLYGAPVVMSNEFDEFETLVWHPTHVGFAMQRRPSFERDRDLDNIATKYLVNQIYGCQTLDAGVRGVMLGTGA